MPIPNTKLFLSTTVSASGGYRYSPEAPGDFAPSAATGATTGWVGSIADLNGDGTAEMIIGSPGSDDKATDAGRVYVTFGQSTGGTNAALGDSLTQIIIDGVRAGDHAGAAVGSITDQNGDGRAEILVGAPLMENGTKTDAGAAFVLWGTATATGIDLGDPASGAGNGKGFIIKGENAGDQAGSNLASIADINGDAAHLAEVIVGAPASDAGGLDSGAAYVVFGKASDAAVNLSSITAGTGGFRIKGEAAGDSAGTTVSTVGDLNGDGKGEILVGAPGNDAGGLDAGAVYVVFGKSTGTEVSLTTIAGGTGGFRITGQAGERAGTTVSGVADINADGIPDILVGAPNGGHAYVVFGKSTTTEVQLSNVAAGIGGYMITPEASGDLIGMSVTGGADFNRDGVPDLVIGTPGNAEGGTNAGAVYVVWGGGHSAIDLSLVAQGIGGAKIVGSAGGRTGSSVSVAGDVNHDGAPDLLVGSPGASNEAANIVFTPTSWQPDPNIYGTNAADTMGVGYGGLHVIGDTADQIYGLGGNDVITGGGGNDVIDGGTGADTMSGGTGNDTYIVDNAGDVVNEAAGEGTDTVQASIAYTLGANVENLVLTGSAMAGFGNELDNTLTANNLGDTLTGGAGNDTLIGGTGNDTLDGGTGSDSMSGGVGNDTYVVDAGGDSVTEAANSGTDTVRASIDYTLGDNVENLVLSGSAHIGAGNTLNNTITATNADSTLLGDAGNDTLFGGTGNDMLDGGTGGDSMTGGAGDDTYKVDNAGDVVTEAAGGGTDTVLASISYTLAANVEALTMTAGGLTGTGNTLDNTITASDFGNTLSGGAGNDTLIGGAGNDTLDGGTGTDTMTGGAGNDTYVVDNAGDVINETAGGGTDTALSSISYTLGAEVEALTLTAAGLTGTGNEGDNTLTAAAGGDTLAGAGGNDTLIGNTGNDTLDGGTGADTMSGGAGNDTYVVDNAGDTIIESAGGGTDTVMASIDVTLTDNVENLVMTAAGHTGTGNAGDNSLTGSAGSDTLIGGAGNDTLDGAGGGDTMIGGSGDDTYYIRSAADVVVEDVNGGFDTVVVTTDWTLADNIEAVQLIGSGHTLTGNAGNNELSGNSGNDTLDGGAGDDTLLAGDGNDTLISTSGHDVLSGGSGDDVYKVHGGQAVIEDFLGNDTIDASEATGGSTIDLSGDTQSEVEGEKLEFQGGGSSAAPLDVQFLQDLTGSFADDIVTVRGLVPSIVGALQTVQPNAEFGVSTFRDKPIGSFGAPGDWVYEQQLSLSIDTSALTAAYTGMVANNGNDGPEAQIEALMQLALHSADVGFRTNTARFVVLFTDAPFHMAGDGAAAGILTPNNGDGIMDGTPPGTGEDYPFIYQVKTALEAANIIPIFAIAGGYDATYQDLVTQLGRGAEVTLSADSSNVVAAITAGLTAATTTQIENATGGEGDDTLTGSAVANTLIGNGGNDHLDGKAGADTMIGGNGNDTYVVDNAGDVVTELAGQGIDTVQSSISYTLGDNVENLVLTAAGLTGTGNALDNVLTGSTGADTLIGGAGNDTYVVDNIGDVVTELAGQGTDTVQSSISYTLGDNVENLVLTAAGLTGTGNALGNVLTASSSADTLVGGAGNDTYVVNNTTDVVTELAGEGTDTVQASVDWTLGANIETLVLTGGALNGTGNDLANTITGNDSGDSLNGGGGNDILNGGAGNDTLTGGSGADTMAGGAGDDSYKVDNVGDIVIELPNQGIDTVTAHITYALGDNVENLTLIGSANVNGIGNGLANTIIGNTANNVLDGGAGDDTLRGGAGNDTLIGGAGNDALYGGTGNDTMLGGTGDDSYNVDSTLDVVTELAGQGTDTVNANISYTLGDNLENLVLIGGLNLNGTGNGLSNVITGNTGMNVLSGLGGNDTLVGGANNDTLIGGAGNDTLTGGLGTDTFSFNGAADGTDLVTDFLSGTDVLQFSAAGFGGGLVNGMDLGAANRFVLGTAATQAYGQFIYDGATGSLSWDADGIGGGAAQQIATLAGLPSLLAGDLRIAA